MRLVFILVKPSVPQNIGSAARALNTMGFDSLRLVAPRCDHLCRESWWMAYGSSSILENAVLYPTLKASLDDIDFAIGTTARKRAKRSDYHSVRVLPALLQNKGKSVRKVALVFGPEEHGLTNAELNLCDLVSTVPLRKPYPSLNLAQAVMVYAYELSPLNGEEKPADKAGEAGSRGGYAALRKKVESVFDFLDIPQNSGLRGRCMERLAALSEDDLNLVHSVAGKLEKKS